MMPAVVGEPRAEPAYIAPAGQVRPRSLIGRFTVSVAGLLTAGCLVLGVGLVVLMVVAPQTGGTGLEASTGPGWPRAGWHLGVGVAAEAVLQLTRRRSWPIRLTTAVVVVIAVLTVLAFSWWSQ